MDRKSIIVLAVCFLLFVLWAQLTPRLYPPAPVVRTNTLAAMTNTVSPASNASTPLEASSPLNWTPPKPGAPEEVLVLTNDVARYTFTSHGGGLKLVELFNYAESVECRDKQPGTSNRLAKLNPFARQPVLALSGGEALSGDGVFKISPFTGTWLDGTNNKPRVVGGVRAEKLLPNNVFFAKEFVLGSNYLVEARTRLENRSGQTVSLPAQHWVAGTATPQNAQDSGEFVGLQWHSDAARTDKTIDRAYFDNRTLGCLPGTPLFNYQHNQSSVSWVTAHNQFFFLALMPSVPAAEVVGIRTNLPVPSREEILAHPGTVTNQSAVEVNINYAATNLAAGQVLEQKFLLYAGPKEYRTLERIGADLKNGLDKVMGYGGFFGFFSRLLLLSMNGLNALGLSYGMAIIAITVIIKLLFWPLTAASTRSMKRMQALQPQMKAMQEKFKDDPAKLNKKMMEFMKENKVSPLGGCLPLLLQIPVFIGFFQMVRSAIELRGASFLWACDLSRPDTIFTIPGLDFNVNPLPLLMGGTMLWQASLTPPSPGMDPAQQKIMRYFPLIFLFMLYNYSAGLTLYWTVQNLLSIAQMKLTKTADPAPAKPAAPAPVAPQKKKK